MTYDILATKYLSNDSSQLPLSENKYWLIYNIWILEHKGTTTLQKLGGNSVWSCDIDTDFNISTYTHDSWVTTELQTAYAQRMPRLGVRWAYIRWAYAVCDEVV